MGFAQACRGTIVRSGGEFYAGEGAARDVAFALGAWHTLWHYGRAKSRGSMRRPAQLPVRGTTANGSEATATTKMTNLSYDEMDKLTPCRLCGSRRYWFDGEVWQCWNCVPPP